MTDQEQARGHVGAAGVTFELPVSVEWNVAARMRDGVVLRADIYRPGGPGPWPTLLTRYPYGKNDVVNHFFAGIDPVDAARSGFMVVVQDSRGSFSSGGEWEPWRHEREDGYDTVEWAAKLPGSNGRVGMYGQSYHGFTQWAAAIERPPSLKAIAPSMITSDGADGLLHRGGALELGFEAVWSLLMASGQLPRLGLSSDELARRIEQAVDMCDELDDLGSGDAKGSSALWTLPIRDLEKWWGALGTSFGAGSIRATHDAKVLEYLNVVDHHDQIEVPSLNTGGWYDTFLQGTLDNYTGMQDRDREACLVVGPWSHRDYGSLIGDLAFGSRSSRDSSSLSHHGAWATMHYAWFRRHLLPELDLEFARQPVRIFVMGRNEWRDETEWPPKRAHNERWYLHGGGLILPGRPETESIEPTEFTYDPTNPVLTHGGTAILTPSIKSPGPYDQQGVEQRDDVVTFTSAPLEHELDVTGRVRVILRAQSSAPSTDWVARLCDVHPDERSYNIVDGISRVTNADRECHVEIDLHSTSNVFLVGHRIRLQVTSSCFPRWDLNLNTGNQDQSDCVPARQRIFHDTHRESYIELPVIP
ncbi:CocE/NonD family hydrolase [Streptomyces sp. NPDC094034]|uniref:CocE/NonD family hydrolase n=1 Tax=Streptomyces sp. NPDC094034 TaxID=3155309 RepID=UPI00331D97BD